MRDLATGLYDTALALSLAERDEARRERDELAAYVRKLQAAVRLYSFCAKDECHHYCNKMACCATFEDMLALLPTEAP